MWKFIILQLIVSNILLRYLPVYTGLDIYRSCNCFLLCCRCIYYLACTTSIEYTLNTCLLYISYTTTDLYYLLYFRYRRVELIVHHIFTIIAYIQLYITSTFIHESFLAHIFLLAELLSIFNWLLRGTIIIKYWRILIIITIRLPIWFYLHQTTNLLQHQLSQYLSKFASCFMPILDLYFLYKLIP